MVCVRPVPLIWLPNLEVLLGAIAAASQGQDVATLLQAPDGAMILDLLQKTANLHPRVDVPKRLGFPVERLEAARVNSLFQPGGEIHALNQIQAQVVDQAGEAEEFPPFASEDLIDNWLADLTCSFQGNYSEALALVSSRDITSVMAISRRLGDLWMGKEKREERGLRRWFKDWEKDNQDLLDEALFGGLSDDQNS
jgi:hypothetical protein